MFVSKAVYTDAGPSGITRDDGNEDDAICRRQQEIKRARLEEEQRAIQHLNARVKSAQERQRKAEEEKKSKPRISPLSPSTRTSTRFSSLSQDREVQAIIRDAKAAEEAASRAERKAEEERVVAEASRKKEKEKECKRKKLTSEEKEANKEKRLTKLVGAVVVKSMSKYAKGIDREGFKKHAKEVC